MIILSGPLSTNCVVGVQALVMHMQTMAPIGISLFYVDTDDVSLFRSLGFHDQGVGMSGRRLIRLSSRVKEDIRNRVATNGTTVGANGGAQRG